MGHNRCQCSHTCEKLPPVLNPGPLPLMQDRRADLAGMVQNLTLLFRVFDNKASISRLDERGFVAQMYRGADYTPERISKLSISEQHRRLAEGHIRHWPSCISPFISTTPLWLWACMECIKRYSEKGSRCKIAVIDAKCLELHDGGGLHRRRVFYGLELLHAHAHRYAHEWSNNPQEVLVFGSVPAKAILSIVDIESLLPHLPPYLRSIPGEKPQTLGDLHWEWRGWDWFTSARENALCNIQYGREACATGVARMAAALAIAMLDAKCISVSQEIDEVKELAKGRWDEEGCDRQVEELCQRFSVLTISRDDRAIGYNDQTFSQSAMVDAAKENVPHESIEDLYDRAEDAFNSLKASIYALAGKIASFGFYWEQDDADRIWHAIAREIRRACERKFEEERRTMMKLALYWFFEPLQRKARANDVRAWRIIVTKITRARDLTV